MSNQSGDIRENWDMSIEANTQSNEVHGIVSEHKIVLPDTILLSKDALLALDEALQVSFTGRFQNKCEELQKCISDLENEKKLLADEIATQQSKWKLKQTNMEAEFANEKKLLANEIATERITLQLENVNIKEKMASEKKFIVDEIATQRNKWELEKKNMNERFPLGDKSTVRINVGGQIFKTERSIFETEPGASTMLGIALSGRHERLDSNEEDIFIDRDPLLFRYILNFLRTQKIGFVNSLSFELIKLLEEEGAYYLMPEHFFKLIVIPEYIKVDNFVKVKDLNNEWWYGRVTEIDDDSITVLSFQGPQSKHHPLKICQYMVHSHIKMIDTEYKGIDFATNDRVEVEFENEFESAFFPGTIICCNTDNTYAIYFDAKDFMAKTPPNYINKL